MGVRFFIDKKYLKVIKDSQVVPEEQISGITPNFIEIKQDFNSVGGGITIKGKFKTREEAISNGLVPGDFFVYDANNPDGMPEGILTQV